MATFGKQSVVVSSAAKGTMKPTGREGHGSSAAAPAAVTMQDHVKLATMAVRATRSEPAV